MDNLDLSNVANGDALRNNVRDALADYSLNPTTENLDHSIDSMKALRNAMLEGGASPVELQDVDAQISKLEGLKLPSANIDHGSIEGINGELDNLDLSHITNGDTLRNNVRDALADYSLNPTSENLNHSIDGMKTLRNAMLESGASPAELSNIDAKISQLEGLKIPSLDVNAGSLDNLNFDGTLDNIDGLSDSAKQQLSNDLNDVTLHPENADFSGVRSMLNNAKETLSDPQEIETINNITSKLDQVEIGSIRDNIQQVVGDSTSISESKVQEMVGKITDYQMDTTPENLLTAQQSIKEVQREAYNNGDTNLANELGKQFEKISATGVQTQAQQITQTVTNNPNIGEDISRGINSALGNYTSAPTAINYDEVQKAMASAIEATDADGNNETASLLRRQLDVMSQTHNRNLGANFAQQVQSSLGSLSNNADIKTLIDKLNVANNTNERLNITRDITDSVKTLNAMDQVDTQKLTDAVKNIKGVK